MKNTLMKNRLTGFLAAVLAALLFIISPAGCIAAETETENDRALLAEEILSEMTLEEKIAQMIIPAIRQWDGTDVTDLDAADGLAAALRAHPYGGVILFAANITGTEQAVSLTSQLQENNAKIEDVKTHIPYFLPVDQEGGIVARIISGCRMNGNMAIGACGEDAEENAERTGEVIGEELAALGFNIDFAPVLDVNSNPANPVIGTRSFSDDPEEAAKLGLAYIKGLAKSGIMAACKHFPGHGDTSVDSHIGTPSVEKTLAQLQKTEFIPFDAAISANADMIMTAHITYPLIDKSVLFGDGKTEGFFPATMSHRMITDILRGELGYDGLVVTDALEMDAIRTAGLVPGDEDSDEYRINVAEKVINAGVDLLLLPQDLVNEDAAAFYDNYIEGLTEKVEEGTIPEERIDESVTRILKAKEKYGILGGAAKAPLEERIRNAKETVGSGAHHGVEEDIARHAVTLLKNDADVLPVSEDAQKIVFLMRTESDEATIRYAADRLRMNGVIGKDAEVSYAYYYDPSAEEDEMLHYTDEMKELIKDADVVIGISTMYSLDAYADGAPQYMGLHSAIEDVHAGGGSFILISDNLPYDAARFQDADAIMLAYLGSMLSLDPTDPSDNDVDRQAFNANVIAAIDTVFGANTPSGTLPVNIPEILQGDDGTLSYGDTFLYERGYGLTY